MPCQWPLKWAKGLTEGLSFLVSIHPFWGFILGHTHFCKTSSCSSTHPCKLQIDPPHLQSKYVKQIQRTNLPRTQWPIQKTYLPHNLINVFGCIWSHVFVGHTWSNNWDQIRPSVESGSGMSRGNSAKSYTPPKRPASAAESYQLQLMWAETTTSPSPFRRWVCIHNS